MPKSFAKALIARTTSTPAAPAPAINILGLLFKVLSKSFIGTRLDIGFTG